MHCFSIVAQSELVVEFGNGGRKGHSKQEPCHRREKPIRPHQYVKAVVHAAAYDVTFGHKGTVDALIRRKLPIGPDAPDTDAYYPYPGHVTCTSFQGSGRF